MIFLLSFFATFFFTSIIHSTIRPEVLESDIHMYGVLFSGIGTIVLTILTVLGYDIN